MMFLRRNVKDTITILTALTTTSCMGMGPIDAIAVM